MTDETRRAIIDALGLSPHAGGKLVEALDARYRRPPAAESTAEEVTSWTCPQHPENGTQVQTITGHGFGRSDTPRCTVLGKFHYDFETTCGKPLVVDLGPVLCSIRMVPETLTPATPATPAAAATENWDVWCVPIGRPNRKPGWLSDYSDDDHYKLRATNEAIAVEMNTLQKAKHWHYEARPVLADGKPGPVPNVCTKCGVNFHDTAYATNGCFHTHYGESTGFSKAAVDAILQRPNDTIRARFEAPSPGVPVVGAHPTEDSLRAGCACSACAKSPGVPTPPASAVSIEEHCLGNDCADKAACECLCHKCCPPKEKR